MERKYFYVFYAILMFFKGKQCRIHFVWYYVTSSGECLAVRTWCYLFSFLDIWDEVLRNETSKICGRQPLKKGVTMACLKEIISLDIIKSWLPQILLDPFLKASFICDYLILAVILNFLKGTGRFIEGFVNFFWWK